MSTHKTLRIKSNGTEVCLIPVPPRLGFQDVKALPIPLRAILSNYGQYKVSLAKTKGKGIPVVVEGSPQKGSGIPAFYTNLGGICSTVFERLGIKPPKQRRVFWIKIAEIKSRKSKLGAGQ